MILYSVCNTCLQSFELLFETSDVELVKQISDEKGHTCPCPRLCGGSILLVGDETSRAMALDPRLRSPLRISGKELYQAVNGLGLPDEIPRDASVLESMLKANTIVHLSMEDIDDKLYLHELHLSNGVTIHLASGQRGAHVLKMTKERTNGTGNSR